MIQVETEFPNPGSIAEYEGVRCRILQTLDDHQRLVSLIGANRHKRVPLADLVDIKAEEDAVLGALLDPSENDARRALWIARHLRDANEVRLAVLDRAMTNAAREGRVLVCDDRRHLAALLRKLGWTFTRRPHPSGATEGIYVRSTAMVLA